MIGEIAVKNAKIAPRGTVLSTSSGRGSGSRSSLPSMVVKSAKTIHLHTNLMRRLATSHVAQSLALAVGVSGAHAMHRFRILEASFVVGDHKLEFTPSRRRLNMVVKNAARRMATQKIRPVAMFVVKNIASASGLHGALAASHVSMPRHFQELVEPSREPTKFFHLPSVVAGTALILTPMVPQFLMARKRLRKGATKMLVAPVNASDHGASGVTAIKHALTVRAMVPLARSRASSLSLKQPCMVENRAKQNTARLRRIAATSTAAKCLAKEHGLSSLIAPRHAETESRSAHFTSANLLSMVVSNATILTTAATPWNAMRAHALSIVLASGQPGGIAARSAVVVRRHPGSW